MLFQILKKDLLKRKGVNFILFLFITLATVFLASSLNNIMVVGNGINHYLNYANVPDMNILVSSEGEKDALHTFMEEKKAEGVLQDYAYNYLYTLSEKSLHWRRDGDSFLIDAEGTSLYLGTQDVDYAIAYDQDGKPFVLQDGEIAVSVSLAEKNQLEIGDTIVIDRKEGEKEFTLKQITKDATFGNDMAGMSRLLVTQADFDQFEDTYDHFGLFYITTDQTAELQSQLNAENFKTVLNTITRETYSLVYSFDLIMAGLLIVVGICLILIALLVLRFTLTFTMEEQYQEIGILKAIGLRDYAIKKLYLIKYLAIVTMGALLGLIISFPISNFMVSSVSANMILESSDANIMVNVLSAILIVLLVLAFCYFCTRKLNRVSVITAIRGGSSGERFHQRRGLHLHKQKQLPVFVYLGMNDIVSHLRRYLVLIVTFCISFILITIPLNTLNTMRSPEMVRKFMLNPDCSIYVRSIEPSGHAKYSTAQELQEGMERLRNEMKEKGYDVELTALPLYFLNYMEDGKDSGFNLLTSQVIGKYQNMDYLEFEEGSAPQLENEVAFSRSVLNTSNWKIGDTIQAVVHGEKKNLIITGSYTDYMQLGNSARMNPELVTDSEMMFDYWAIMVDMDSSLSQQELANQLSEEFPEYEWRSAQELVNQNVGGIQDMLDALLFPMTGMLCAVIMLITLLMERLFITREKGEIAMMKSCGFAPAVIRKWQMVRMICVVLSAMLISIPLSFLSNEWILRPIFAIMGADVAIQVDPLQVYILYPVILLAGILAATAAATRIIRKIDIKEMNNLE